VAHIRQLDLEQVPIVSFQLSREDIGFSEPAAAIISVAVVCLTIGSLVGLWRSLAQAGQPVQPESR
jgi:hypothetical protein